MKKLFSTDALLLVIIIFGAYWLFFKDDESSRQNPYFSSNVPIGVSDSFNQQAIERLGLDLTENLDPRLIPDLMTEAMRETVQSKPSEKDFLPTLVNRVSNKIRDISTIDLNEDGIADPILVVPNQASSGNDHLVFSILVPDPSEVSSLPNGSDQNAWRDIAENKSIEIMTASAVKSAEDQMTMQSAPNPQMYQTAGTPYPPYYSTGPSLSSIFLTSMAASMMTNWLFMPSYGMGFGYYNSQPMAVNSVQQNRSAAASSYSRAQSSSSAAKSVGGSSVAANKFRSTSSKSMNQIKSSRYRSANRKAAATGFGRSQTSQRKAPAVRRTPNRSRSLMRTPTRRSFGGFGRRRR